MTLLKWIISPVKMLRESRHERQELHRLELVKWAEVSACAEEGTITASGLDTMTAHLEAVTKPTTKKLKRIDP